MPGYNLSNRQSNLYNCVSWQVVMWLNQNFLLPEEIEGKDTALDIMFLSLRTGNPVAIKMDQSGNVSRLFWRGMKCCAFCFVLHLA